MVRFKGKTSWWYWALTVVLLAFPLIFIFVPRANQIWFWPLELLMAVIVLPPLLRNRVDVFDDRIEFAYGFSTYRIPLDSITGIDHTRCALAGTANSLNRLHLAVHGTDGYDDILIALCDNDGFIAEINKRREARHVMNATASTQVRTSKDDAWR